MMSPEALETTIKEKPISLSSLILLYIAGMTYSWRKAYFLKELPITNYQLPITNYQLPITNYQLPITNYQLPITN